MGPLYDQRHVVDMAVVRGGWGAICGHSMTRGNMVDMAVVRGGWGAICGHSMTRGMWWIWQWSEEAGVLSMTR